MTANEQARNTGWRTNRNTAREGGGGGKEVREDRRGEGKEGEATKVRELPLITHETHG